MKTYNLQDLMVPLSEYATVSEEATLFEAVAALEQAQEAFDKARYPHRAILVLDKDQQVIGKLSQMDVLKALEPKYHEMLDRRQLWTYGFTAEFMKSMLKDYHLFDGPMQDICRKAGAQNVKNSCIGLPRKRSLLRRPRWTKPFTRWFWGAISHFWFPGMTALWASCG